MSLAWPTNVALVALSEPRRDYLILHTFLYSIIVINVELCDRIINGIALTGIKQASSTNTSSVTKYCMLKKEFKKIDKMFVSTANKTTTTTVVVVVALSVVLLCLGDLSSPSQVDALLAPAPAAPQGGRAAAKKCPAARERELDEYASHMGFLGDHSFRVPTNLASMSAFCDKLKNSISNIQAYSRECLAGFTRQILNVFMKRGKQQQASMCQADANKLEFMTNMACLKDEARILQFHKCMDGSIGRFEFIMREVKSENRIPVLCCSYQIFFKDVDETLTRVCGGSGAATNGNRGALSNATAAASATAVANKYVQKLVVGTTGEFIQLACDDHRSIEDCRASPKTRDYVDKLQQLTKRVKEGKQVLNHKSLLPPLLDILNSGN